MFIQKKELEKIRQDIRNINRDLYPCGDFIISDGLIARVKNIEENYYNFILKIEMLIEYFNLELVNERPKKYFREKAAQKEQ